MRLARTDRALDAMNEERDHLAIQISLLDHADTPDPARLAVLRQKLSMLEHKIVVYRPSEA